MTKNNSVQQMVACLSVNGAMPETLLLENTFGYIRSCMISSNKKYADMLRRGLKKGIIKRCEIKDIDKPNYHGNIKFLYYV
jgi:hypothetical protein